MAVTPKPVTPPSPPSPPSVEEVELSAVMKVKHKTTGETFTVNRAHYEANQSTLEIV